ncbi:hypothetical protein [Mucilaginibacter terrae]|uniref:Uncharacterized protein n=1 Tax=Mucilaginibacter terrae TaxID=1955052 RepID=A0ABU3GY01_9SPHI|nr:hypothetical protein [Mucilaginibacter terrae]MDT3403550.1 hypothetical protein [Mucilaginibacter terrae]
MNSELVKKFIKDHRGQNIILKDNSTEDFKQMVLYCYDQNYIRYNGENHYLVSETGLNFLVGKSDKSGSTYNTNHVGHIIHGGVTHSDLSIKDTLNFSSNPPTNTQNKQNAIVSKLKSIWKWMWSNVWSIFIALLTAYIIYKLGWS